MRARVESSAWSLVVFTVFAQAAAGTSLMRFALPWLLPHHDAPGPVSRLTDPLVPVAAALLVVALLAAVLHIANPKGARFAVSHLGSSWLSREIVLGSLFGALLVVDLLLGRTCSALSWATAVSGVVFVQAIVRVYRIRTVPAWDTPATPVAFFSTTVLLGTAAAAVGLVLAGAPTDVADQGLRGLGLLALGVAGLELLSTWLHLRGLDRRGGVAAESARVVFRTHRALLTARVFCAAFGALLLHGTTWPGQGSQAREAILVACGLLLLSELLARFLFYASHRRVGL